MEWCGVERDGLSAGRRGWFLREYGEEYSRGRFIKRLRSATYETLRDEARRQQRGSSDVAHALAIAKLYNLTGGRGTVDPRRLTVLD